MRLFPHLKSKSLCKFILLAALLAAGGPPSMSFAQDNPAGLDSDRDGLSDELEIALGLDPHYPDSDLDGVSDGDEYELAYGATVGVASRSTLSWKEMGLTLMTPSANPVGDLDGDNISDFLETYGYYQEDNQLVALKRIVDPAAWQAFRARGAVLNYSVYSFAAQALESNGYIHAHPSGNGSLVLNIAAAHGIIRDKFIAKGIPENHVLIVGSTAQAGSIAAIMRELAGHGIMIPSNEFGLPKPYYYTHPKRASTDNDPYSDYEEALGLFNAGAPVKPADHPLIAAAPSIRASIVKYLITEISESRLTHGQSEASTEVLRNTTSFSHSHGFAVSTSIEKQFSASPSVKFEVGLSQNNQWSFGSSLTREQRNTHSSYSQRTGVSSSNCFSKLGLTIDLANIGSATAADVQLSLNIYLGDELWQSVPVNAPGLSLRPGEKSVVTILGQGAGDYACLTLAQTNYLEQGGLIGIETGMTNAKVNYYNGQIIEQGGSWGSYSDLIEAHLARIDLDVTTSNGSALSQAFWVVAEEDGYPNIRLSIEDVLAKVYARIACDSSGSPDDICFDTRTSKGVVRLTENAAFDFAFYDASGKLLSRLESKELYATLPGVSTKPLSRKLAPRSTVSIVERAWEKPQFSHLEVISSAGMQGSNATQTNSLIRALARDFFGIDAVYFCENASDSCRKLDLVSGKGPAGSVDYTPTSGLYQISLPGHVFTGQEYLKAVSISGRLSEQSPEAFFLILGESLHASLLEYDDAIVDMSRLITQLRNMAGTSDGEDTFSHILSQNLMIQPEEAERLNGIRQAALAAAKTDCGYDVSDLASAESLAAQISKCMQTIDALKKVFEEHPIKFYNPVKLPFKAPSFAASPYVGSGPANTKCQLEPGQFMVGIDVAKLNDASTPTVWIRSRTFDPVTEVLSGVSEQRCGPDLGRESKFSAPAITGEDRKNYVANVILDAGASIGLDQINGRNNGTVTRLCVSYRPFNFLSNEFEDDKRIACDGNTVSAALATEANTGGLYAGNENKMLQGVKVGGESNSSFQEMMGRHVALSTVYPDRPYNTLVPGARYRIEDHRGNPLTVTGTGDGGSRGLAVRTDDGSDSQVWLLEAVNDREFRLVPGSYTGFVSRSNDSVWVSAPAGDDATKVYFKQHWRLEKLVNGAYLIQAAQDEKVLSGSSDPSSYGLSLGDWNNRADQQWNFVRLDGRTPEPIRLRANQASLAGAPAVLKSWFSGFTGEGYITFANMENEVSWTKYIPSSGRYRVSLRLASGAQRPLDLNINGKWQARIASPTDGWGKWRVVHVEVELAAGLNKIALRTSGKSGPDIDSIDILPAAVAAPDRPFSRQFTSEPGFEFAKDDCRIWNLNPAKYVSRVSMSLLSQSPAHVRLKLGSPSPDTYFDFYPPGGNTTITRYGDAARYVLARNVQLCSWQDAAKVNSFTIWGVD